jgi:hypothetical protein
MHLKMCDMDNLVYPKSIPAFLCWCPPHLQPLTPPTTTPLPFYGVLDFFEFVAIGFDPPHGEIRFQHHQGNVEMALEELLKCVGVTDHEHWKDDKLCIFPYVLFQINPLNTELNPICHLLALLGAHPILSVSTIRVNMEHTYESLFIYLFYFGKLVVVNNGYRCCWCGGQEKE